METKTAPFGDMLMEATSSIDFRDALDEDYFFTGICADAQGPCCHGQCRLSGSRTQEPVDSQSEEALWPLLGGQPSLTAPLNPPSGLEGFGLSCLPEDLAIYEYGPGGQNIKLRGGLEQGNIPLVKEMSPAMDDPARPHLCSALASGVGADPLLRDQPVRRDVPIQEVAFRVLGKKVFQCTYRGCETRFTRLSDLRRHHTNKHHSNFLYLCRFTDCERRRRGFSRKDKRDDHERKVHEAL